MAIIKNDTDTFPKSGYCFMCGEPVVIAPYIFWQGGNGEGIALHPDCAEYLGINLLDEFLKCKSPEYRGVRNVST